MTTGLLDGACPARTGEDADAVDGVVPAYVASPRTVDEAAAVMRTAAVEGLRVVPRGAGSQLTYGAPPSAVDIVVDTSDLGEVLEHAAGDLVCRVQAGVPLRRLQAQLAPYAQQLALDRPTPEATVGGIVATSASGPLRLRYGTPRDLLIGITVVRADGAVAHSGGKVVKNVAGYDLGKLYTGSLGTLGLIVEAAFRLHPLPAARGYVRWESPDGRRAYEAVRAVLASPLMPAAIEIDRPSPGDPVSVAVLVEGHESGVADRAPRAAELLGPGAEVSDRPPSWWAPLQDGVTIKLAAETAALPSTLEALDGAASQAGVAPSVRGSAGTGALYAGLPSDTAPAAVAAFVGELRDGLSACGGTAVVQRAPTAVRAAADVWGHVPGLELMRRIKDQFDPDRRLNPGRFVGGI